MQERKIGYDKVKHFYVGIAMAVVFQPMLQWVFNIGFWQGMAINMALVNIIGFGFELFSKLTGLGHAELNDALATTLGGIVGGGIVVGVYYLLIF